LDFHHTIDVRQLRATVEVHIHYSFEPQDSGTQLHRWLVLDITIPLLLLALRPLILRSFDRENVRTIAAVTKYAEAHPGGLPGLRPPN
jgi:hypothetical protein